MSLGSAWSSIEYDLPDFCASDDGEIYDLDFQDYLSIDYDKELAVCYVASCDGQANKMASVSPYCVRNYLYTLNDDYWEMSLIADELQLDLSQSESNDQCVILMGLAECDPDTDPDGCYNVIFDEGGWSWLPSDRYNDVMNVHMVLEMNDPSFTEYWSSKWGSFTGDYCRSVDPPPTTQDLSTDLVAYFTFDLDGSESLGADVISYGNPDFTNTGLIGNCYKGNGYGDTYFSVSSVPNIDIPDYYNWSYSFWAKGTGYYGYLFDAIDSTSEGDHISAYVALSDYKMKLLTKTTILSTYTMDNDWIMVTVVLEDGYYKFYSDGSLIYTSPTYNPIVFPSSWKIGADSFNANNYEGYIDEMGYWTRALSSGEVSDLYNSGDGLTFDGYAFTSSSPDLNVSLVEHHPNKTIDYNETYCYELDYYFDNWDYFNITYYDPYTNVPYNISLGELTINSDYFEVGLGVQYGYSDSRLCVESYEQDYSFNLTNWACSSTQCVNDVVYFDVEGNYSASVSTRQGFQYRYVLTPEDPSQYFSFNYFFDNYDEVDLYFLDDGSNRSFSCDKTDGVVHSYNGTFNYTMTCDNNNVLLYTLLNSGESFNTTFYVNVSNSQSYIEDYFKLVGFSGTPVNLSSHPDIQMSFYDTYSDTPSSYLSDYDTLWIEYRIPETNNYGILDLGDPKDTYDQFDIEYKSDGTLVIASKSIEHSFCVWYVAENSYGETYIDYSVVISDQGLDDDFLNCGDQPGSIGYNDPYPETDINNPDTSFFFRNVVEPFGEAFPDSSDLDNSMKFTLFLAILMIVLVVSFVALYKISYKVALWTCIFLLFIVMFFFVALNYISPAYPVFIFALFGIYYTIKLFGQYF